MDFTWLSYFLYMEINKLKEKLEAPMVQARYQYAIDVMLTRLRMIDAEIGRAHV